MNLHLLAMILAVPFHRQSNDFSCGPACLRMLFAFHDLYIDEETLINLMKSHPERGTADKEMINAARMHGFRCTVKSNATWNKVVDTLHAGRPILTKYVAPDGDRHFALLIGVTDQEVVLHDPYYGENHRMAIMEFKNRWLGGVRSGSPEQGWMMTITPHASTVSSTVNIKLQASPSELLANA